MAGRRKKFGPLALTTTMTTNIFNPSAGTIARLLWIRVANNGAASSFQLWIGASAANAAGTHIAHTKAVPANDYVDAHLPGVKMVAADFLVGGAADATRLSITGIYEEETLDT